MEGSIITGVHLSIAGSVSGMNANTFVAVTKDAVTNCLISKGLRIPISSEAHLIA
jgi:osmotically inducible protein OsmC